MYRYVVITIDQKNFLYKPLFTKLKSKTFNNRKNWANKGIGGFVATIINK